MLVAELKNTIKGYTVEEKEKLIVELYKAIPKYKKEENDIDSLIMNVNQKKEKVKKVVTFSELEKEVNYFLECAQLDLYAYGNKVISKKERSNWRFKVKRFYKELNSFPPTTMEGKKATDLLMHLFRLLSTGTHYLKFSSWNTFGAIQVPQPDFLELLVKRKLEQGPTKEIMKDCVNLLVVEYDPQEWHRSVLAGFEVCLKTVDLKYLAIEALKEKIVQLKEQLILYKTDKKYKNNYQLIFTVEERIQYLVECVSDIYFLLREVDNGISYFHKNYIEDNKEVKEYILLEKLDEFEFVKEWILEYEKHVGKIDYRDSLKEEYLKKKEQV